MKFNNIFSLFAMAATMSVAFASCNSSEKLATNDQDALRELQPMTRAVGPKTPKLTVYIETNDVNPLNAKEYRFCGTTEEVIDHVILFASNIRGVPSAQSVSLYHNPNQTYILNHASTLIQPLQQKGIKVLLGLLGDHQGVGFANLTPDMIEDFAQDVASCVNTYGLDGVDFDDEYADYWNAGNYLPSPSGAIYGALVEKVKQLLPGKLVTAFRFGNAFSFPQSTLNVLDYMWPDFGANNSTPSGFPDRKWAKLSIHNYNEGYTDPGCYEINTCASNYSGYGAIMFFNMREGDQSSYFNCFAPYVWGRNVCWTGVTHYKNY